MEEDQLDDLLLKNYFQEGTGCTYNAYTDALQVASTLKEQNSKLVAENKKLQESIREL